MPKEKQNKNILDKVSDREALEIYRSRKIKIFDPNEPDKNIKKAEKHLSFFHLAQLKSADCKDPAYLIKYNHQNPDFNGKKGALLGYNDLAQICKYIYQKLQNPDEKRKLLTKALD